MKQQANIEFVYRFKISFAVLSDDEPKKLETFLRWECFTIPAIRSAFFKEDVLICSDLASAFKSGDRRQPTASPTSASCESAKHNTRTV